jgi:hypothetical protein
MEYKKMLSKTGFVDMFCNYVDLKMRAVFIVALRGELWSPG